MGNKHPIASLSSGLARPLKTSVPPLESEGGIAGAAPLNERDYGVAFHEILPENRIFLGDLSAAGDVDNINAMGVTHVLTTLGFMRFKEGIPDSVSPSRGVKYYSINIADSKNERISRYFRSACFWLDEVLKASPSHRVLIHCLAGVSRSATFTTAFVMVISGDMP
jgi:Dual specificity phosphatase, catalytic domain